MLKQYDTVVIVLKSQAGDMLDVVFRDSVDDPTDLPAFQITIWRRSILAGFHDIVFISYIDFMNRNMIKQDLRGLIE